ncbi:PepSY-associated TM helix domain-containing protein [Roseomonas sp. NAR14]|uniref:PepSY-associated TM helix domain-containing protein n=1 Tax=Roseomonas acroporae TaxID=2937791 RepID=A0A9X1Y6N0_9PROT|nr:PepSY-associated TM helix domain-containing protein [Roseomonas acroporae]
MSGAAARARAAPGTGSRAFWLRHLHRWHWISSAICLIGMLLFAATGITLNHAADIPATPRTTTREATLPAPLLAALAEGRADGRAVVPEPVRRWIGREFGASADREAEWSRDEVYVPLPRPGGDAFLTIDRGSGAVQYEETTRGWIAWLNDLHKGRNTGAAWSWFIDAFAVACLVFCVTGLFLLHLHAGARPLTWPLVGLGLALPLLLVILSIH